jgi:propanol-preferring alcohol dehydrogenase
MDRPPVPLQAAVTFAPAGQVVLAALRSLDKGAILSINAIHLDQMPSFDYDSLLWQERQIRSVANMTRQDARDYLAITDEIGIRPEFVQFPLSRVQEALDAVRREAVEGSAVLVPGT